MLALIFIYFIGKPFFDLAGAHKKHQWGFAILGVVLYYAGSVLGIVILGIVMELSGLVAFDDIPEFALNLLGIPLGILACWILYKILKKQWSKAPTPMSEEVLDGDLKQL
jgi:hypothetical protein